jgi:hypothetical protein
MKYKISDVAFFRGGVKVIVMSTDMTCKRNLVYRIKEVSGLNQGDTSWCRETDLSDEVPEGFDTRVKYIETSRNGYIHVEDGSMAFVEFTARASRDEPQEFKDLWLKYWRNIDEEIL